MTTRIAPSAALEAAIEELLADGLGDGERLAEIGRLGARLVLQRAVEEEVTAFLGRARYERTPEARGSRNGNRPRQVQQVRGAAEKFVSSVIPNGRTALRTRPLEALIIGGWVRGLSDRDIESLAREAGLGLISESTVCEITKELRARYQAFPGRSLVEVELLVLFCDAIYLPTRPSGAKEGVLVAWGYNETGQRVLLDVVLGQRERFEDWLEMGRDLVRRGLRAPMLVVTDGAPGLIRAIEELWPVSDRQRCTVHRWRNVAGKLPKNDTQLHERVEAAYWAALDEASSPADGEARLRRLVTDLERSYPSAAACLAEDLPVLCVHLAYPLRLRRRLRSTNLLERSLEEGQAAHEGNRSVPWRDELPEPLLGRARPVHRQRSRSRAHRTGAQATGADARRPPGPYAGLTDRMRCCWLCPKGSPVRSTGRTDSVQRLVGASCAERVRLSMMW